MWVKALDILLDRLKIAGVDFSKVASLSGTAQVSCTLTPLSSMSRSGWIIETGLVVPNCEGYVNLLDPNILFKLTCIFCHNYCFETRICKGENKSAKTGVFHCKPKTIGDVQNHEHAIQSLAARFYERRVNECGDVC
jgi:hypothetical protein